MPAANHQSHLTIQDLLNEPELGLTLVAGRRGVGRHVGGVHVSEMPDPTPWLAPRDVLLTTGLSLKDQPGLQRDFVRRLSEAGIAALGFAAGITEERSPEPLRQAAEEAGLPLFEVDYRTPFKTITSYIFASLLSRDMHRLRRSLSVQDHLLSLLVEEKGADHLVSSLSMLLSATIILFDSQGHLVSLAQNRVRMDAAHAREVWRDYAEAVRDGELPRELSARDHRLVFREIRVHGRMLQVLATCLPVHEHLQEFADIVLTYAQKLLALDLLKSRDTLRLQRKIRADLVDELVAGAGSVDDLGARLRACAIDPAHPLQVLVLEAVRKEDAPRGGRPGNQERLQEMRNELQDQVECSLIDGGFPTISASHGDTITLLLQPGRQTSERLRGVVEATQSTATLPVVETVLAAGLSDRFTGLEGCPRAHGQARGAARLARAGTHGTVVAFGDLGPSVRSLENQGEEHLRLFYESTIKPLEIHDNAHKDDLVRSLTFYFDEKRSVSRAARRLFIHQNTLRYRLKKIESVLGVKLDETETIVDLYLGLKSRMVLQDRGRTDAETRGSS